MVAAPFVRVHALPTGYLWLPDRWIFADGDTNLRHLSPDYSFLISHPSGKNVLFDLGMRKDLDRNPRVIREDYSSIEPYVPKDAYDLLSEGPIKPQQIDLIVLSHLHFDHSGDVTRFPEARILVGPGTRECIAPGYPASDGSPFDGTVLTHAGFSELESTQYQSFKQGTVPLGFPFETGVDMFGDGSLYILNAPGHMPGHQMALARTGQDEWVAMGGDCCHHRTLLEDPSRDISVDVGPNGQPGFHKDPDSARSTIHRTRKCHSNPAVFVLLAHDAQLDGHIPIYPKALNGWRSNGLKSKTRIETLTLEEVKTRYY
ncbi:hypothetical protein LTR99_004419 [Exophiala xenobiotica]|uniref:Metallo-beta-lactamase domain-containing protein n=1 Tax=Vermiconidia calcicola TaxID=1690605 RepID=A0AAV9QAQ6_9PEZI|nr:hypothetical protein H2202_003329 [Exophiala xenobiotica]KAK5539699.1 hypothetical protein LTR25_003404 [Vermiconidia calcicola]KAK5541788.1 hypothetical protein LTR23_005639 [Chaetothyriales sp. CCFEE 6169]KAK5199623.1 hypothetical protein LTR92_000164 [Exophiala xenobiotica]KAK5210792.1 hypothetical protein LTR41_003404 [Exophiala xenobiotica]